jgi:small subunit ribosomal protein S18
MRRDKKNRKKRPGYSNKLSLFQKPEIRFRRNCPLSIKNAPEVDYKNIKLLRKYISDTGKILPSRITSVSENKQRALSLAIKRAKILGLV